MSLPATEPFTGTGALSASWTQVGFSAQTLARSSDVGKATAADSAHDVEAYWTGDTFSNDQYSQVTVSAGLTSGLAFAQALVRASGTGSGSAKFYLFATDGGSGSGHTSITKVTAGETYTTLQNITTTFANGNQLKISVNGTTIRAFKNGTQVGTDQTDSAIASGSAGCGVYNFGGNDIKLDDWEGGNLSSSDTLMAQICM